MKIYVIIPGYNEERYLVSVLKQTKKVTNNIVYVDDGSTDRSYQIAKKSIPLVLHHQINLGKGAALKTGCEYAFKKLHADAVILMDSDGQHNPSELIKFIKHLEEGAKFIFGVRNFTAVEMPLVRFIGNKFASAFLSLLFGKYIPDIPSGFKAVTKSTYKKIQWTSSGYEVEAEIAARVAKFNVPYELLEIKTIYHDVDKGVSALDALHVMRFLVQLKFVL